MQVWANKLRYPVKVWSVGKSWLVFASGVTVGIFQVKSTMVFVILRVEVSLQQVIYVGQHLLLLPVICTQLQNQFMIV